MPLPTPTPTAELDALVGSYRLTTATGPADLTLTRKGAFLHASCVRVGLALPWQKRLVIAFGPLRQVEIGAYKVTPKAVTGLWVPPGADQADYSACGFEDSAPDAEGTWRISKAVAIDKSPYAGKVTRDVMHGTDANAIPRAVHMLWRLDDGEFHSFALDYGDALYSTFCFTPEEEHGVSVFDLRPLTKGEPSPGATLTSTSRGVATESLVRI